MTPFNIFISVLILLLYAKWIILILSLLPIRVIQAISRKQYIHRQQITKLKTSNDTPPKKLPFIIRFFGRIVYGYIRYIIFQIGLIPSHHIRNIIYRHIFLVKIEAQTTIYWGTEIRAPYNLQIGKRCIIGDKALLDARNGIIIGENVQFSSNVHIYTEQHDYRDPWFRCNSDSSFRVQIDNYAWIGSNVTILPKVHIGEGAVVAAGSVVTKDIAPFTVVGGVPAKKIGERPKDLKYTFSGNHLAFY